jgi:hypothetical protein
MDGELGQKEISAVDFFPHLKIHLNPFREAVHPNNGQTDKDLIPISLSC